MSENVVVVTVLSNSAKVPTAFTWSQDCYFTVRLGAVK